VNWLSEGRIDLAVMSGPVPNRKYDFAPLFEEEMVLVTRPGTRPPGIVTGEELSHTPLVLGDGLRTAMDALLAGRGIELKVEIELNDHETIRLMVQQSAAVSILPYSSVARECAQGLIEARRLTADGIFRTLALGVRVSRSASLARDAVAHTITEVVADMETGGRLALGSTGRSAPRRGRARETASYAGTGDNPPQRRRA